VLSKEFSSIVRNCKQNSSPTLHFIMVGLSTLIE
jgi:hypothetical protein